MWYAVETAFVDGKLLESRPCFDPNLDPNYRGFAAGTTHNEHHEEPRNSCETHMNRRIEIHTDWFQTMEQALDFCAGKITYIVHSELEYRKNINSYIPHFMSWETVPVEGPIVPFRGLYKQHLRSGCPVNDMMVLGKLKAVDPSEIELDKGIAEYPAFYSNTFETDVSIGISYESAAMFSDGHVAKGYIFNLFIGDEYINIDGAYDSCISGLAAGLISLKYNELEYQKRNSGLS